MKKLSKLAADQNTLQKVFSQLTVAGFEQVGFHDDELVVYLTDILVRFVSVEKFLLRDVNKNQVQYLVDMQLESMRGDSVHARIWQKHIGDFALFMVGMYPEWLERPRRPNSQEYFVLQGQQAYASVASIDRKRPTAGLFAKLSEQFKNCVHVFRMEKEYLEDPFYQYIGRQVFW